MRLRLSRDLVELRNIALVGEPDRASARGGGARAAGCTTTSTTRGATGATTGVATVLRAAARVAAPRRARLAARARGPAYSRRDRRSGVSRSELLFWDAVDRIRETDERYRREAYGFVVAALGATVQALPPERLADPVRRHLGGAELLRGVVRLARQEFGALAPTVFREWGVTAGEDVGRTSSSGWWSAAS